jgi:hypothetical protein
MTSQATELVDRFDPGTPVEVVNRFARSWSTGFEVHEAMAAGYRLRRLSDGAVLPAVFVLDELRLCH